MLRAFQRDFEVNGPSIVRIIRTTREGWKRHKNDLDKRVRRRFKWESRDLAVSYSACLWAARRWYRGDKPMLDKISRKLKREARRLSEGRPSLLTESPVESA